jgi:DNA replication protein DnaD
MKGNFTMAFISVSDELQKKSFTNVENKFITKYMPVLEPIALKVYLYTLYLYQSGQSAYTLTDLAQMLSITEEQAIAYYEYLEEMELCHILSRSPFEVSVCDCSNSYGTPKKYKPEKYADFAKSVQNILKKRMISPTEFREYFSFIEDYGFDSNALLMIITYCVNLRGEDIRFAYIKKVVLGFAAENATSVKKVEEKLSDFSVATPSLLKLFSAVGITRRPDIDDEKLYKKWTSDLGFEEDAIISAAKHFKAKNVEKIDAALQELYKNRKFDCKEIEDYCKTKNSILETTVQIARSLGVYMQNSAPYVETYVSVWIDLGFESEALKSVASYCFTHNANSFEAMNDFVQKLYSDGIVTKENVEEYLEEQTERDKILKNILSTCGYSRKVIDFDRQCLTNWQKWGFSNDMLYEAAKRSSGAKNPLSYMNAILSDWKQQNIFTLSAIPSQESNSSRNNKPTIDKAAIERHYAELRRQAEEKAEKMEQQAMTDKTYASITKKLNSLSIQLAFAEVRNPEQAKAIAEEIRSLEEQSKERLQALHIDKSQFKPQYQCKICNDTGYDKFGKQCDCLKRFLKNQE